MIDSKSYEEFILGLFAGLFNDCSAQYPALSKEFDRDYTRLSSAVDSHGVRFVLDVMPAWCKHFDKCLAQERLIPSHLPNFGSWKKGGVVPRFLRGLTLRVFDVYGVMKPEPDLQAVRLIRQLLKAVKRMRLSCGPKDRSDAVREFIRTDLEVRVGDLDWSSYFDPARIHLWNGSFTEPYHPVNRVGQGSFPWIEVSHLPYEHGWAIQQVADRLTSWLGVFNPEDVKFRHGPGAVSDQPFGRHKYDFRNWPDRLEEVFPMADFAVANYANWVDSPLYRLPDAVVRKEFPAKLIAVPKTIKTPRLIASEPTSLQWCQQSIRAFLYSRVSESPFGNFVDFRRQEKNGALALKASHDGSYATIDLSSASDRVSCWHVERLFRRSPTLLNSLRATRSLWVDQQICRLSPRFHQLRKYSTMGNATTFPVQSLFFLAVALGSLHYSRGLKVTTKSIGDLGESEVRVFGDDIIVPNDCAEATICALNALGLRVNHDKTFTTGRFRESCGVDAFGGQDVTAASVLDVPKRAKPGTIVSSVDVHNNLCDKGLYAAATWVRRAVERIGAFKIPDVMRGSGSFGWVSDFDLDNSHFPVRVNRDLQVRQIRCHSLSAKSSEVPSEGSAALLQFFTEAAAVVTSSFSSLTYHEQRAKPSLKLGWVTL